MEENVLASDHCEHQRKCRSRQLIGAEAPDDEDG